MSLTILLRCHNLEETREFYQSVLGFKVRNSAGDTLTVEQQGATLIFTSSDLWKCPPNFSGTIYFGIKDVDGYFASVKDKAVVTWPLQDMSYGTREFGVKDCNGYHLAFRQQANSPYERGH